jgi:hypothetical protein
LYDANGSAQLLNVAWSFEAAERVVREHADWLFGSVPPTFLASGIRSSN